MGMFLRFAKNQATYWYEKVGSVILIFNDSKGGNDDNNSYYLYLATNIRTYIEHWTK